VQWPGVSKQSNPVGFSRSEAVHNPDRVFTAKLLKKINGRSTSLRYLHIVVVSWAVGADLVGVAFNCMRSFALHCHRSLLSGLGSVSSLKLDLYILIGGLSET
jgi:hypothetical protein